jgi:hypothetical protein
MWAEKQTNYLPFMASFSALHKNEGKNIPRLVTEEVGRPFVQTQGHSQLQ